MALGVMLLVAAVFLAATVSAHEDGPRTVTRVVDGDTLVLDGGERIRLIGVDTPETVHPQKPVEYFGKEASAFTRRMADGQEVRLEYDQQRRDRYGPTLAYVWLPDDSLLNLEIIRRGSSSNSPIAARTCQLSALLAATRPC